MTLPAPYYQDDAVTLYHADCRELLPLLSAVDLVFTSPPYNLGNTTGGGFPEKLGHYPKSTALGGRGGHGKWGGGRLANGYGAHTDDMPHEDYICWQQEILTILWAGLSPAGAIFYNHKPRVLDGRLVTPFAYLPPALIPHVRQIVIWKRSGGINFSPVFYLPMHEWITIIARDDFRLRSKGASGIGDVWTVHQAVGNEHPAPFPIGLPSRAIETTAAQLILDPFAGSGTTLMAAKMLGRKAIGIELQEEYCEMAARRMAQAILPLEPAGAGSDGRT